MSRYGFLLVMLLAVPALAAPVGDARAFAAKDYATFLSAYAGLADAAPEAVFSSLPVTLQLAIAVAKLPTHAAVKPLRALAAQSPEIGRRFTACGQLLDGDAAGLAPLFAQERPALADWRAVVELLDAHGFPTGADIAAVPLAGTSQGFGNPDLANVRLAVCSLANVPRAGRATVYPTLLGLLTFPAHRQAVLDIALEYALDITDRQTHPFQRAPGEMNALRPALKPAPAEEFLDIVFTYGKLADLLNLNLAQRCFINRHAPEALRVVDAVLAAHPTEDAVHLAAAKLLWSNRQTAAMLDRLAASQRTVPEPQVRAVRRAALEYRIILKNNNRPEADGTDFAALRKGDDRCLAGDLLLLEGDKPAAAAQFRAEFTADNTPLPRRVDAWLGWLESDPSAAVRERAELAHAIAALPEAEKTPLAAYLLHAALPVALKAAAPVSRALTALLADLYDQAPAACLIPPADTAPDDLRLSLAALLVVGQQPEKAVEVIKRPISIPRTSFPRAATAPGTRVYPNAEEYAAMQDNLLRFMVKQGQATDLRILPLLALFADGYRELALAGGGEAGANAAYQYLGQLTKVLAILDAYPANTAEDTARVEQTFARFHAGVDALMTDRRYAGFSLTMPLAKQLVNAKQPATRARQASLLTLAVDRYVKIETDPTILFKNLELLFNLLNGKGDQDIQNLLLQLRNRYGNMSAA